MNLNQVTLPVYDMAKAVEFYLILGFTQIVDTAHYARFECPEGEASFSLSLEQSDAHLEHSTVNNSQNNYRGAIIYFEHEQLDEWVSELEQAGIMFETSPADQSYLWREAVLFDPSGNKIKLYWAGDNRLNPPWRVDKKA